MITLYKIADKDSYDLIIKKIHDLNNVEFAEFSGFRMGSFLAASYYEAVRNGIETGKKQLFKNIIRCFIKDYSYDFNSIEDGSILLFYSHEHARRQDYVRLMNDVQRMIPSSRCFTGIDTNRKVFVNKQSLRNIRLLSVWNNQLKPIEDDAAIRAFLISKISLAYRWKQIIYKNINSIKRIVGLITLFDAREYENILTQICNDAGIRSATLEHGFFYAPFFENENNNYFAMPFLGFVSTEFWAWGNVVKENGIKAGVLEDKIKVVGYPRMIKNVDIQKTSMAIGIILDGGKCSKDTNLRMIIIGLEYAKNNGFRVLIKPHPYDYTDYLQELNITKDNVEICINRDSIEMYAKQVAFSICFNSSAYIDLLAMKARVFRYKDSSYKNLFDFLGEEDCFNNIDELKIIVENYDKDYNANNRLLLLGDVSKVSFHYSDNAKRLFLQGEKNGDFKKNY